jgi:alpha-beta hydrolase superfamily lysophospholipase
MQKSTPPPSVKKIPAPVSASEQIVNMIDAVKQIDRAEHISAVQQACLWNDETFEGGWGVLFRRSARPVNQAVARLLIIHGYGDHGGRYVHFMQWLAEHGIACDAVDLRGQGRSPGWRGYVDRWENYLDDVHSFVDRCKLSEPACPPPFLLGHSHGGLIVAALAERGLIQPGTFRGIVLTSPFFRARLAVPYWKRLVARAIGELAPGLQLATGLQPQWLSSDSEMIEESRVDPFLARVATPRWYLRSQVAQRRVLAEAASFTFPVLCLAAGDDPIADPSAAEDFVRRAGSQDKTFRIYPGLRHEILRETNRREIFQAIYDWIAARMIWLSPSAKVDEPL